MGAYRRTRSVGNVTTKSQKQCQVKSFAINLALMFLFRQVFKYILKTCLFLVNLPQQSENMSWTEIYEIILP